jgi:acyl-ACP thioesterase
MSSSINTYTEKFKVRSYEVDVTGRATILTISNFLQEIAGNHAGKLGVSVDKLFAKKLTWVLSRLHLKMFSYPFWREEVSVLTWPSDAYGKFATRDFEIFNSKNELIGKATTSWMLIDLTKMKPITMPDFIMDIDLPERERAINDKFDKLPKLEITEFQNKFNVRLSDLDINQHVNNVNYIEWATETIPIVVSQQYQLNQFEISFRAESKYGDSVISNVQAFEEIGQKTYFHSLINNNTELELAVARSNWTKK